MTGHELQVRIEAPAKINLGLEIIGRRRDGYHEVRSILAMIDLTDTLTVSTSVHGNQPSRVIGMDLATDDNLIVKASRLHEFSLRVDIDKRIPMAAGLGGASSDAAATLFAGNALQNTPRSLQTLSILAATIGSDVPFFLGAPCATVSGTGTELTPLPPPTGWVVLATPEHDIPQKTGTLYGCLLASDFSDGSSIASQVERIQTGQDVEPSFLQNAFSRALGKLFPDIIQLKKHMLDAGCPFVALSGAGPTHYSIVPSKQGAERIAANLSSATTGCAQIMIATFRTEGLSIQPVSAPKASPDSRA